MSNVRRHMHIATVASLLSLAAAASSASQPAIVPSGVTGIMARSFSSPEAVRMARPSTVEPILSELSALERKKWQPFKGKVGACTLVLVAYRDNAPVQTVYFNLSSLQWVVLNQGSNHTGFVRAFEAAELPNTLALVQDLKSLQTCSAIPPAKT